ncbi:hypothetical protein BFP76_04315 [Amylibacter kogurei]|uniref:Glycosyl transferase family 1 domain-containing protein n=1 Tax=Paramylibacter kogurei TaxID=1889778 RepID=A0A2G5K4U0_9RHOB|nr:hypothetical protein [Amylibacter kogurei]PIB24435.1 hypothetical protein BFP76_04315 [Amylibacter kogurei]
MKHQLFSALNTNDSARANTPENAPINLLVYAHFSPDENPNWDAINLVTGAINKAAKVTTVSGVQRDFAQYHINFATPHKYETSFAQLGRNLPDFSHIIIYLKCIVEPELTGDHPWKRIKERRRMVQMMRRFVNMNTDVIFVGTARERITFMKSMFFTKPRARIHYVSTTNEIDALSDLASSVGSSVGQDQTSLQQFTRHANFEFEPGALNPRYILRHLRSPHANDAELATLCRLALSPQICEHEMIHRIKNQFWPCEDISFQREKKSPIELAQQPTQYPNITRYMLHLFQVFNLQSKFNLSSTSGRNAYISWYQINARSKVPTKWIPQSIESSTKPRSQFFRVPYCDEINAFLSGKSDFDALPHRLQELFTLKKHAHGPTGLMLFFAMLCGAHSQSSGADMLWRDIRLVQWFDAKIRPNLNFAHPQTPNTVSKTTHKLVINGITTGCSGLAANLRMTQNALDTIGLKFETIDTFQPHTDAPTHQRNTISPKRNVLIHHVNAERVPLQLITPELARRNDIYQIGFPLWELSRIPDIHHLGIDMLDELWVPSKFVADLYAHQTSVNIQLMGKSMPELDMLDVLSKTRQRDGDKFRCLTAFDFHSSVERKNPIAAVYAFQKAFPRRRFPDCEFIIKTTKTQSDHWGDPNNQFGQIRRIAFLDSRIKICESILTQANYFRLLASADCLISPHRGEGFGYFAAYALALAKPLIVTNYGGTQDFCNYDNSYPIVAPMIDVPKNHAIYPTQNAQWADISPDAIAKSLQQIYTDYDLAKQRAFRGQREIQTRYCAQRYTQRCFDRLQAIGVI